MYKELEYRTLLRERGMNSEKIDQYVASVERAARYFSNNNGLNILEGAVQGYRNYVSHLIDTGQNSFDELMAVGRYVYLLGMKEVWIYYVSILGGISIYPSIRRRLSEIVGDEECCKIFNGINVPPTGSDSELYSDTTMQLMEHLKTQLLPETYRLVLAGNHHKIPIEVFFIQRDWLRELNGDIDAWLKKMHGAAVDELSEYLREDKVWYEQVITQDIVNHVKDNQEILSGVRDGDWIYNTKFPYSPQEYLDEENPLMKRYYMCHCPLARDAVLKGEPEIPMDWCYCSAGYCKLRYDVAFGEETEVEVLETVFSGSDRCRFRIRIPEKWK